MTDLPGATHHAATGRDVPWTRPDAGVESAQPSHIGWGEGGADTTNGTGVARAAAGPPTRQNAPGSVPLRPLNLGDILDGTFAAIRRNPRAVLGLSALLVTIRELVSLGTLLLTGDLPTASFDSGDGDLVLNNGISTVIGFVISAIMGAVLTGMIAVVVSEDLLGRRTTAAQVWRRIRPRFWALLVAAVLAGATPYFGLLFLVAPGVLLWGGWALTAPVLVLEEVGPVRAVRRSWRLAWPAFGRVYGIRTLSVFIGGVIRLLVAIPFALVATLVADLADVAPDQQLPPYALALVTLGAIVAGTLVEPFLAGVLALLYMDRRMRAEGLDIAIQLSNRKVRGGTGRTVTTVGPAGGSGAPATGPVGGPAAADSSPYVPAGSAPRGGTP